MPQHVTSIASEDIRDNSGCCYCQSCPNPDGGFLTWNAIHWSYHHRLLGSQRFYLNSYFLLDVQLGVLGQLLPGSNGIYIFYLNVSLLDISMSFFMAVFSFTATSCAGTLLLISIKMCPALVFLTPVVSLSTVKI